MKENKGNKGRKKNQEEKFDDFFLVCFTVFTVLMLIVHATTSRRLYLNPFIPFYIFLSGTMIGLIVFYWVRRIIFKIHETVKTYLTDLLIILKSAFLSMVVFGSLASWTFIYFNFQVTEKAAIQYQRIKFYSISLKSSGTHNSIYFKFMGTEQSINNFTSTKIIQQAAQSKKYDNYLLNLTFRKGLLGCYTIDDWSVIAVDN